MAKFDTRDSARYEQFTRRATILSLGTLGVFGGLASPWRKSRAGKTSNHNTQIGIFLVPALSTTRAATCRPAPS